MLPDTFSRTPAFSVPTSDKKHKFSWRFITALHWNLKSCRMIARYSPLMSAMHSATFGHLGSVIPSWSILISPCRLLSLWWAWQPTARRHQDLVVRGLWPPWVLGTGGSRFAIELLSIELWTSLNSLLFRSPSAVQHPLPELPNLLQDFWPRLRFFPLQNRKSSHVMSCAYVWKAASKLEIPWQLRHIETQSQNRKIKSSMWSMVYCLLCVNPVWWHHTTKLPMALKLKHLKVGTSCPPFDFKPTAQQEMTS